MKAFLARTLVTIIILTCLLPLSSARYNRKYLAMGSRLVEYVTSTNFSQVNFPSEPHVEFRHCHFESFGPEMFRALDASTKRVTFRKGTVRDITVSASHPPLEMLQIIDTGLVTLEAEFGKPNRHLKQLTVRSKTFSEWSFSLTFLLVLEEIDIAYCNFSYLNVEWFAGYGKLRVLDVSKNRLAVLDIGQSSVRSLERLHLWGNRLEQLHRFPEAFPQLEKVSLAQNRWHCRWVSDVRGAIARHGVVLMDMDSVCQAGWENNAGLCCRRREDADADAEVSRSKRRGISKSSTQLLSNFNGTNGSVIGIRVGNTAVYLDQPLNI